ncbi:hypothetical protein [Spiroplasma endosymbiont of Diplazon laetatorius]|uniref:hypothetical protein n=1 Tax=Spiroplasma endosymbiont of Diplazon laetatorius TaxID=3066322 RepID=UPI0030CD8F1A
MRIYLYSLKDIFLKKSSILCSLIFLFISIFFSIIDIYLDIDRYSTTQIIVMMTGSGAGFLSVWVFLVLHFYEEFYKKSENGTLNLEIRLKINAFNIFARRIITSMIWMISLYLITMTFEVIIRSSLTFNFWYYYSTIISKYLTGLMINFVIICLLTVCFSWRKIVLAIISSFILSVLYLAGDFVANPLTLKKIDNNDDDWTDFGNFAYNELKLNYRITISEMALKLKETNNTFRDMCDNPEKLIELYNSININYGGVETIVDWKKDENENTNMSKLFFYIWKSGYSINLEDIDKIYYIKASIVKDKKITKNPFNWMEDSKKHLYSKYNRFDNIIEAYNFMFKEIDGMKKSDGSQYTKKEIKEIKEIINLATYSFNFGSILKNNFIYSQYENLITISESDRLYAYKDGEQLSMDYFLGELFNQVMDCVMSTRIFSFSELVPNAEFTIYSDKIRSEYSRLMKINYYLNPLAGILYLKNYGVSSKDGYSFSDNFSGMGSTSLSYGGRTKVVRIKNKNILTDSDFDINQNDFYDNVSFEIEDVLINKWIIFIEQLLWTALIFYITSITWKRKLIV